MYQHVVLLKINRTASASEIQNFYNGIACLRDIPGVVSVECGEVDQRVYPNYPDRSSGYTHIFVVTLQHRGQLEAYDKHHIHSLIKNSVILPLVDRALSVPLLAVDYTDKIGVSKATSKYWIIGIGAAIVAVGATVLVRSRL